MNATIIPAPVPARAPVPTQPSPVTLVPNPGAADGRGSLGVGASGLGSAAVDAMLAACVADGQNDLYADFTGCEPPGAGGLASKATLESRGWEVFVAS